MNRRLYYISTRDMRKNRADAVHIMKSCQELARTGFEVLLITPRVRRSEYHVARNEIFGLYGMKETFKIIELPTLLSDASSTLNTRIQKLVFNGLFYLKEILTGRLNRDAVLYAKCYAAIYPALLLRRAGLLRSRIFFEKAEFSLGTKSHRFTAENVDGILGINRYICDRVIKEYGIPADRVYRLTCETQYNEIVALLKSGRRRSRAELGLPEGGKIAMYAGKTSPEMPEIRYLLEVAKQVPEHDFVFVGTKDEFKPWFEDYARKNGMKNVTFIGFQPLEAFYEYTSCADVLLSYYDSADPLSSTQRVPGKASVYLCLDKPIIMADLPSLRELWTDDEIYFVPPDQPPLVADCIRHVFAHPEEARLKAERCLKYARENTYETSYRSVVEFMDRTKHK